LCRKAKATHEENRMNTDVNMAKQVIHDKLESHGTDALMHAEILSYSRSRGLFAGVNLKGVVIRPEDDLNQAVYSKGSRELLSDDGRAAADSAAGLPAFPQTVARYTATSETDRRPPEQ
jgi:lipid-binding SYLF domain-containing protein